MKRHTISLSICLSFAIIATAEPFVWTGWLGPNRDGWVAGFQPPDPWPDALEKNWQVKVGAGYASPLVVEERIFQHARQGDSEVVMGMRLDNGDIVWKQEYAVPFKIGMGAQAHGKGPKSSPAYADGRLFTMSITGRLSAWDTESGDLLWKRDYNDRFEQTHPYWGVSTSPIVDGNKVFAHFGNDKEGVLVALDVESGDKFWANSNDAPSYSSPLVATLHGVRQLVEWNHRAVVGVQIDSGEQLWEYPFPHVGNNQNMPTPTIHHGRVIVGGENRGIHAFEPVKQAETWQVSELWHQDELALDMSTAVINDGLLFGFSHYDRGRLFCVDPATGKILWTGPPRTAENVALLSVPSHVIALLNDGQLLVIAAEGDEFNKVATYRVSDGRTWTPPVMLPDGMLTKDDETLTRWVLPESN